MRTTLANFAIAALFVPALFGQSQDKTFYFTQPATPSNMTAMATLIRTVVDVQNISVDQQHQALVLNGPVDKLVATEWIFQQLDRSAGESQAGTAPQYKMGGENGELVSVFRLPPTTRITDLTAAVTAIRTVVDLQRLFPYEAQMAIVARGASERVAAAAWILQQLYPPGGTPPTGDSPAYPSPLRDMRPEMATDLLQVFRMDSSTSNADLTAMVTAIRTVADLQRLFPFEASKAIIASGSSDKIAVAEWMVHELDKPSDPHATHETRLPGLTDGVVRVFYMGHSTSSADLVALITQIRNTLDIMRIFPLTSSSAIVLRGRPDQIQAAQALVAKSTASAQ
jgi:hypothetical protein